MLGKDPCIDQVATVDIITAVRNRTLSDLHPRRAAANHTAVTPKIKLHVMTACARLKVFEVGAKQVMAFDYVGVALAHDSNELFEHRRLVNLGTLQNTL